MNSDFLARLLEIDFTEVWIFIVDVMRSPASNVTAFAMILAAITVVMLIVVLVLLMFFLGGESEYEEDEDGAEPVQAPVAIAPKVAPAPVPLTPEEIQRRKVKRTISSLVWLLIFAAVWMVGGFVSRQDTLCVSCHGNTIHQLRLDEVASDPHGKVACASCHETPNIVAGITTAVPGRAVHFVAGFVREPAARGYGTPVANRSCNGCHQAAISVTTENEVRGVRMSHVEPLEARALCSDCHRPRPQTGVVNRFTVGMDPCMRCHNDEVASAECSFCHTKDVGLAIQARGEITPRQHALEIDCGGCHDQRTCDNCHGIRMPHSIEFKGAGHARAGVEDLWYNGGKMCGRCHTANRRSCQNCHNTMPSHGLSMRESHKSADPDNNGCVQCHDKNQWIVGRHYCGLCHPQYNRQDKTTQ